MIEKDTIKGLECCTDEWYENCNECTYSIDNVSCERMKLLEDSLDLINHKQELLEAAIAGQETLQKALAERNRIIKRLIDEKVQLIKTFGECQERAVKDFAKAVIGGLTDGRISKGFDMVDFAADYLRGKR